MKYLLTFQLFLFSNAFAQVSNTQLVNKALSLKSEEMDDLDYSSCFNNMDRNGYLNELKNSMNIYLRSEEGNDYLEYSKDAGYSDEDIAYGLVSEGELLMIEKYKMSDETLASCVANIAMNMGEQNLKELTAMMQASTGKIKPEELGMSLPVYPGSIVVSSFDEQQSTEMIKVFCPTFSGRLALSSAILTTNDPYQKVVSFYQQKLGNYNTKVDGEVTVISEKPVDINNVLTAKGCHDWATVPLVWIEKVNSDYFPGSVKIEIHYQ